MAKFDEIMDRAEESFNRIMGRIAEPTPPPGATATSREDMLTEFRTIEIDPDGLTLKRDELVRRERFTSLSLAAHRLLCETRSTERLCPRCGLLQGQSAPRRATKLLKER